MPLIFFLSYHRRLPNSVLCPTPLQIQRQQAPQDRLVVGLGRIFGPAVGDPDFVVDGLVGVIEPRWMLVAEIGY
jgi:hypothetical protein